MNALRQLGAILFGCFLIAFGLMSEGMPWYGRALVCTPGVLMIGLIAHEIFGDAAHDHPPR